MNNKENDEIEPIGNFIINVIGETEVVTETEVVSSAKFNIEFDDGTISEEMTVPLTGPKGLAKLNWFDVHPYIQIYPKISTVQQRLANLIRAELPYVPKETQYRVNHLGTSIIDGKTVFNTGGDLIRSPLDVESKTSIVLEPSKYNLDIDTNLSERDAVSEMMKIVLLSPDAGQVIFSHSLLYLMRKAYESAWKSPCCILFLYSYTGTKKTTLSAFLTQLHNRADGIYEPMRLNSSVPAAEAIIYEKSDCVIVLDDLFPVRFRDMKMLQEKTLLEITRVIADGVGRGRMRGNQVLKRTPTCGVIFTGEYLVGYGSDAARLLPIKFTTPVDIVKLKECQDKPLVVSTFYYFYIKWYIENYYEIIAQLKLLWRKYQMTDLRVHDRLRETHFFLSTAYRLFLQYCAERGFTTTEKAQSHHQGFEKLLTGLVREQNERVNQGSANTEIDAVDPYKLICTLYKSDGFTLAKNKKRFDNDLEKYDGLIHDKLLCLRSEKLIEKFKNMGYSTSLSDLRHSLIAKGALWLDGEGKNKKIGQLRVVGIHIDKLK